MICTRTSAELVRGMCWKGAWMISNKIGAILGMYWGTTEDVLEKYRKMTLVCHQIKKTEKKVTHFKISLQLRTPRTRWVSTRSLGQFHCRSRIWLDSHLKYCLTHLRTDKLIQKVQVNE